MSQSSQGLIGMQIPLMLNSISREKERERERERCDTVADIGIHHHVPATEVHKDDDAYQIKAPTCPERVPMVDSVLWRLPGS